MRHQSELFGNSKIHGIISQKRGEGFVDTAIKILISVVIGALLLAGLYALFGNTIMPTVTQRIKDMFDYAG
ncbi:hypothetical protein A7X67_13255 [Clostridium sp. W14A]|nr:hypothetical protein A7X67_13255 [Clostridium sp. W14A]